MLFSAEGSVCIKCALPQASLSLSTQSKALTTICSRIVSATCRCIRACTVATSAACMVSLFNCKQDVHKVALVSSFVMPA